MIDPHRYKKAISSFDAYHVNDPHTIDVDGRLVPKELLYAERMSKRLDDFYPAAPEYLKLAARCQHIGRWEVPRETFPMDKKGYLQWRNVLKSRHANLAEQILASSGYDESTIEKVKSLVLKKGLHSNADTQALEDVICLVFIEYYLEEFTEKHEPAKVVDILQKTLRKMSGRGIEEAGRIQVSERLKLLLREALKTKNSAA